MGFIDLPDDVFVEVLDTQGKGFDHRGGEIRNVEMLTLQHAGSAQSCEFLIEDLFAILLQNRIRRDECFRRAGVVTLVKGDRIDDNIFNPINPY